MHKRGSFDDALSIVSVISIEQKNRREATKRRECYRLNRFRTRIHRQDGKLGFLSLSYDNSLGRWYSMILDLRRFFLRNCSEINVVYLSRLNIFYRRHKEMHVQLHLIIANNYWWGFSSLNKINDTVLAGKNTIQTRKQELLLYRFEFLQKEIFIYVHIIAIYQGFRDNTKFFKIHGSNAVRQAIEDRFKRSICTSIAIPHRNPGFFYATYIHPSTHIVLSVGVYRR